MGLNVIGIGTLIESLDFHCIPYIIIKKSRNSISEFGTKHSSTTLVDKHPQCEIILVSSIKTLVELNRASHTDNKSEMSSQTDTGCHKKERFFTMIAAHPRRPSHPRFRLFCISLICASGGGCPVPSCPSFVSVYQIKYLDCLDGIVVSIDCRSRGLGFVSGKVYNYSTYYLFFLYFF